MVTSPLQYMAYVAIFVWLVELTEFMVKAHPHIILPNAGFNHTFLIAGQNINKIGNLTSSISLWQLNVKKMTVSFIQAFDPFPISISLLISGKI